MVVSEKQCLAFFQLMRITVFWLFSNWLSLFYCKPKVRLDLLFWKSGSFWGILKIGKSIGLLVITALARYYLDILFLEPDQDFFLKQSRLDAMIQKTQHSSSLPYGCTICQKPLLHQRFLRHLCPSMPKRSQRWEKSRPKAKSKRGQEGNEKRDQKGTFSSQASSLYFCWNIHGKMTWAQYSTESQSFREIWEICQ